MTFPVVELRVTGRVTAESVRPFRDPLLACAAAGRPFCALFDRSAISAPTPEGRAALAELYARWESVARLVVAWADVYDPRRAASLLRARQARLERGEERPGPPYPYRVFDDPEQARAWLAGIEAAPAGRLLSTAGR